MLSTATAIISPDTTGIEICIPVVFGKLLALLLLLLMTLAGNSLMRTMTAFQLTNALTFPVRQLALFLTSGASRSGLWAGLRCFGLAPIQAQHHKRKLTSVPTTC